jgi:hypothetical protein
MSKNEPGTTAAQRAVTMLQNRLNEYDLKADEPTVQRAITTLQHYTEHSVSSAEHQLVLSRLHRAEERLAKLRHEQDEAGQKPGEPKQVASEPPVEVDPVTVPTQIPEEAPKPHLWNQMKHKRLRIHAAGSTEPPKLRLPKKQPSGTKVHKPRLFRDPRTRRKPKNGRSWFDKVCDKLWPPEMPKTTTQTDHPEVT